MLQVLFLLLPILLSAQPVIKDAGLWLSLNVEKKITPVLSFTLNQDFRMDENISQMGEIFTGAGFSYKFSKMIHISGEYRFINKRKVSEKTDMYYSKRHRYYLDLSLRKKIKPFMVIYRARFQSQYKDFESSPDGEVPQYYWKNKLSLKWLLKKKYTPYVYGELSTPLNARDGFYNDVARICAGIEYTINRMNGLDLSYLIEREYNVKKAHEYFVIELGYYYTF